MYERGDYENANDLGHQAFDITEDLKCNDATVESFEVEDIRSNVYYTLGAIAQITHMHQESLDMHEKLLKLRKRLRLKPQLSRGDPLLAHAYNELGNDYMTTSEYHIAIGHYKTSIETYLSLEDSEKSMIVLPSVNLGLAYWLQGNYDQAAATVHDALQDRERDRQFGIDDKQSMK
jgi:tetratricopeptide (TPR) repeat protein